MANFSERANSVGFLVNHRSTNIGLSFIDEYYSNPFGKDVQQTRIYAEAGFSL